MNMIEKELLEKNRFTKEEYEKKVKEQFRQMLEDIEMEEIRKKQKRKANADMRKLKRMVQNKKEVDEFVKKAISIGLIQDVNNDDSNEEDDF